MELEIITLWDDLGDYWELIPITIYRKSETGLIEMRAMTMRNTNGQYPIKGYQIIPLPVFTDWWPEG